MVNFSTPVKKLLPWLGVTLCVVLLLGWYYPPAFQIADERAYIGQAIDLVAGNPYAERSYLEKFPHHVPKYYPLGTAALAAPLVAVFGPWSVFALGTLCWIGAAGVLYRLLSRERQHTLAVLLLLVFPPAMILSRHVMSELPSALLIAALLVLAFRVRASPVAAVGVGALAIGVVWFREANLLLTLPLLIAVVTRMPYRQYGIWVVLGGTVAILLRLGTSYWAYGDAWYLKDPGVAFTLAALPANLPIYLFGTLVLLPGGLYWWATYRGPWWRSLSVGLAAYLLLHLCYDYRGQGADSGYWGGLILTWRFLIPAVPILVVMAGWSARFPALTGRWRMVLATGWLLLYWGVSGYDYRLGAEQRARLERLEQQGIDICGDLQFYEYCSALYGYK